MQMIRYFTELKSFKVSIICVAVPLLFFRISYGDPVAFLFACNNALVFTLFPALLLLWFFPVIKSYESEMFFYRVKQKYHDEKKYFITIFVLQSLLFSLCINVVMTILTGFWLNIDVLWYCLKNFVYITLLYTCLTYLFFYIYSKSKNVMKSMSLTMCGTLVYSFINYYTGTVTDYLMDTMFLITVISILLICIVLMHVLIMKQEIGLNHMTLLKYAGYAILIILQIQYSKGADFNGYLTFQFYSLTDFDINALASLLLWLLPKIVILADGANIVSNYLNENLNYFLIRGTSISWYYMVSKRIVRSMLLYASIHLCLCFAHFQSINMIASSIDLFLLNYIFLIVWMELYTTIRIMVAHDNLLNYFICVYVALIIVLLKSQISKAGIAVLLIQSYNVAILGIYIVLIGCLFYGNCKLLKYRRLHSEYIKG